MKRELTPIDNRKSFYGKAYTITAADGTETLYSYDTPIMSRTTSGILRRSRAEWTIKKDWTPTTARHIAAFLGKKITKAQFFAIPTED